ncbi:hypothetical protein BDZ45DRAFT_750055 [Acephala macrosclerotiorum]|nr:hypothetical protein BDZ45DRAFT_750055 [Acephala macrosclerotiorum]
MDPTVPDAQVMGGRPTLCYWGTNVSFWSDQEFEIKHHPPQLSECSRTPGTSNNHRKPTLDGEPTPRTLDATGVV